MGGPETNPKPALDRVRLHITPFNPALLDRFISKSLRSETSAISFHAVATDPDRGFGYVEMPATEAQKLKKKLNGSTLKGMKVRIEDAKPKKKRKGADVETEEGAIPLKKTKKDKAKRENGVVLGHELEEGRYIKRGWADNALAGRRKSVSSTGKDVPIDKRQLRFRTVIPQNAAPLPSKPKEGKTKEKKSKPGTSVKASTVREFSRTTRPRAVKGDERRVSATYEDGKGWVDENGSLVEPEPRSTRRAGRGLEARLQSVDLQAEDMGDDNSESSVSEESSEVSSTSSDSEDDTTRIHDNAHDVNDTALDTLDHAFGVPVDDALGEPTVADVHPLEALFKQSAPTSESRPRAKRLAPIDTAFSFFDPESAQIDGEEGYDASHPPQTPHTKEDLRWRQIRSAAPTPDTAAIGKHFKLPLPDEDEEADDVGIDEADAAEVVPGEESEFRKWFYENRGDLNRSWKTRRRDEKKLKRQRENRRISRKLA